MSDRDEVLDRAIELWEKDRQRQRDLARAAERVTRAILIARPQAARQVRQQHDANGNPHHPQRQLVQPVSGKKP